MNSSVPGHLKTDPLFYEVLRGEFKIHLGERDYRYTLGGLATTAVEKGDIFRSFENDLMTEFCYQFPWTNEAIVRTTYIGDYDGQEPVQLYELSIGLPSRTKALIIENTSFKTPELPGVAMTSGDKRIVYNINDETDLLLAQDRLASVTQTMFNLSGVTFLNDSASS